MKQKITYWLSVIAVGITLGLFLQFARAWTEPSQSPPNGNVGAPINTGNQKQVKNAGMDINGRLKVADDTQTPISGQIRYTGSDFEGYMGGKWLSLTAKGGGDDKTTRGGNCTVYWIGGYVGTDPNYAICMGGTEPGVCTNVHYCTCLWGTSILTGKGYSEDYYTCEW